MAKTLAEIQIGVRHHSRDDSIILTDATSLAVTNRIYRALALLVPWPELRRSDTSLTTTDGTSTYDLPIDPVFQDIRVVEIQDIDNQNYYRIVSLPADEITWNEAGRRPKQPLPHHYQLVSVTNPNKTRIEFRPTPSVTGQTIKITGIIEPQEFTTSFSQSSTHTTVFRQKVADDALEMLIASDFADQTGGQEGHFWADKLLQKATIILQQLFSKDQVPEEELRKIIQR